MDGKNLIRKHSDILFPCFLALGFAYYQMSWIFLLASCVFGFGFFYITGPVNIFYHITTSYFRCIFGALLGAALGIGLAALIVPLALPLLTAALGVFVGLFGFLLTNYCCA